MKSIKESIEAIKLGIIETKVYFKYTIVDMAIDLIEIFILALFWSELSKVGIINYDFKVFFSYFFGTYIIRCFQSTPVDLERFLRRGSLHKELAIPYNILYRDLYFIWGMQLIFLVIIIPIIIFLIVAFKIRAINIFIFVIYSILSILLEYHFSLLIIMPLAIYGTNSVIRTIYRFLHYFLSGSLIPFFIFPDKVVNILKLLPFYYMRYAGAKQLIFGFNISDLIGIIIWLIISIALARIGFYKTLKHAEPREN